MAGRRRPKYALGDWFSVPLADGRVAPGRVVRHPAAFSTLSYVFAPVRPPVSLDDVRGYQPGDAIAAVMVSGLEIGDGWELLGGHEDFDPGHWPLPEFEHMRGSNHLEARRIDDRLRDAEWFRVPLDQAGQRQMAGMMGSLFLERWLPLQLSEGKLRPVREQVWWPGDAPSGPTTAELVEADEAAGEPSLNKVVLVLPEPDPVWDVEDLLHEGLLEGTDDVDGNLMSPDGAEIYVYSPDPTATARRITTLLAGHALPPGTHLRIEVGDDDPVRIDLP